MAGVTSLDRRQLSYLRLLFFSGGAPGSLAETTRQPPMPIIDPASAQSLNELTQEPIRCKTGRDVDLTALPHASTTFVHDLAGRLRCNKSAKAGRRPSVTLLRFAHRPRPAPPET